MTEGGKRRANKSLKQWVAFVKKVAKEEGLEYKDAMKRAKARSDKGEKWQKGGTEKPANASDASNNSTNDASAASAASNNSTTDASGKTPADASAEKPADPTTGGRRQSRQGRRQSQRKGGRRQSRRNRRQSRRDRR